MSEETTAVSSSPNSEIVKHNQFLDIWLRFRKRKVAVFGLCLVVVMALLCAAAPLIAPYDFDAAELVNKLEFPSLAHPFGTDNMGRDILTRMLYGGRTSLLVSLMGCAISIVVGVIIGAVSGYFGGKTDMIIMRCLDVLMAIPGTLLAICISATLGSGLWQTALAVSVGGIASASRLMRGSVLTVRQQEYMEAAAAYGSSHKRIIFRHVIPNCLAPMIVDTTLRLGSNILLISGMSFIGLGVQPPYAEWGAMLNAGRPYIRDFWPLCTIPGIAIVLAMLGFNLFGDGLRDALDPKLKD